MSIDPQPIGATPPDVGQTPAQPARPRRSWLALLAKALRCMALAAVVWLTAVLTALVCYRWIDPPVTSLTAAAWVTGNRVEQQWVPLDRMAPSLVQAVVVSEDGRFCQHRGIDLGEIENAMERSRDGIIRGASTISMQVVKNLFLWPQRSYVRKALEMPLTLVMEFIMPKRRIMEIYLNIAEWGPNVFGAEAAARHHFRKPALRLTEAESALLAVTLPGPSTRNPARPGPGLRRVAGIIETRAKVMSKASACVLS